MILPQILASSMMAIVIMPSLCAAGSVPAPNGSVIEQVLSADEQTEGLLAKRKDAFMAEVERCWNVGALSAAALEVKVVVQFEITLKGKPISASVQMMGFEGGDEGAARQTYQSARRAIIRCGMRGYKLPPEKYEQWKIINITFNPSNRSLR